MTTGRINQVTVLRARPCGRTRQRVPRPESPFPGQSLVTDRFKSSTQPRTPNGHLPRGRRSPNGTAARVPSPPISHASGTLPQSSGLESAPSVKTTNERPRLQRGLPERGVSPIDWLQTVLAQRQASPHPPPSLAANVETRCEADLPGSKRASVTRSKSQATIPIPSGHILQGRRINRSVQGRPTVPQQAASNKSEGPRGGGVNAKVIPSGPSTPRKLPPTPTGGHQTSGPHAFKAQQKTSARLGTQRPARPRFRTVKGQPVSRTLAHDLPSHPPAADHRTNTLGSVCAL
jgi:hypothetical protein